MLRKIASVVAISPLALSIVTTAPAQAQLPPVPCNQFIVEGANFNSASIYPRDPAVYSASLIITHVHGSSWSGIFSINNTDEDVQGIVSRTDFTMRRPSRQQWSATCTSGGISGNFRKQESPVLGAFVLSPSNAR